MDTFLIQTNKQITFKKRKTENGEKRSWTQGVETALQRSSRKNVRATVSNATPRVHVTFEETGGERGRAIWAPGPSHSRALCAPARGSLASWSWSRRTERPAGLTRAYSKLQAGPWVPKHHCTDEETEVQRGEPSCGSGAQGMWGRVSELWVRSSSCPGSDRSKSYSLCTWLSSVRVSANRASHSWG